MKKIMQRFLGIAAAAALIVTYAVPVMATSSGSSDGDTPIKETLDPSNSYTITLKETETEKNGEYGAYQIFTGTIPEASGTIEEPSEKEPPTLQLTDIKWGNAFGDTTNDIATWRKNIINFVIALATSGESGDYAYAFNDFDGFEDFVNTAKTGLADRFYIGTERDNDDVDFDKLAIEVAEVLEKPEHQNRKWLQQFTDILGGYAGDSSGYKKDGYVTRYYASDGGSVSGDVKEYKITVPAGYYMIKEFTTIADEGEALSARLLFVANNITQTLKTDVPKFEKHIQRAAATDGTGTLTQEWGDTEAAGVGDTVTFQLTATLPDNYDNFVGGYLFTFKDTFSKGLTVKAENVVVSVTGYYDNNVWTNDTHKIDQNNDFDKDPDHKSHINEAATKAGTPEQVYTVSVKDNLLTIDFPCIREILFDDDCRLGYDKTTGKTSTIYVEYTATVNINAIVAPAEIAPTGGGTITKRNGNLNTAILTYSDNPQAHDQTDDTTSESATVYTYGVEITKANAAEFIKHDGKAYDVDGNPISDVVLSNAEFVLLRHDTNAGAAPNSYQMADFELQNVTEGSFNGQSVYKISNWTNTVTVDDDNFKQAVNSILTDILASCKVVSNDGIINISGLDDGVEYYLVEVKTPDDDQFATIKPFTLKLTAAIKNDEYTGLLADDTDKNDENDGIIMDEHEIKTGESLSIDKFVQVLNNDVPASTADKNGIAELIVANFKYVDLPSTGGTGTYIFYIIGGVVVAASLVLFFLSRKKTTK